MQNTCAVILAAGDGKRMRLNKPKVLCEVLWKPMISWVGGWCEKSGIENICVVLGNQGEMVAGLLPPGYSTVYQAQRRGTGHALMQARVFLEQHPGDVLVLCGDAPFVDDTVIAASYDHHKRHNLDVTVITALLENPQGYGRVLRQGDALCGIIEQADATPEQAAIREVNSGAYWFKTDFILQALSGMDTDNAQGEYYLTQAVDICIRQGGRAGALLSPDSDVVLGANDLRGLRLLSERARVRILDTLCANGVELLCSDGVLISPDTTIGEGTVIYPNTVLRGECKIGAGCVLGPNTMITNSSIGDGCVINASQIDSAKLGSRVSMGPFSRIRPDSNVGDGVKIGNFVEVKNSILGEGTKLPHLTYVGDSDIGARVNFGCGCVTVNYDGSAKYRTVVEDDVFIGCNTNLIAPVTVGKGSYIAAGSTINRDVPADAFSVARVRQENRDGGAVKIRAQLKARKAQP